MALTTGQTIEARRRSVLAAFPGGAAVTVTKAQIDAAVAAATAWLEANAASYVASLNGTVLSGASSTIQAKVLAIAAEMRYGGDVA